MRSSALPHDRARRSDDLVGAKSVSLVAPKVAGRTYPARARRRAGEALRTPITTLQ